MFFQICQEISFRPGQSIQSLLGQKLPEIRYSITNIPQIQVFIPKSVDNLM